MASPLNNPMVAGGLALGAVCFILYKFVPEDWLERLSGPSAPALPPPIPQSSVEVLNPDKRVFLAYPKDFSRRWQEAVSKQMFSWDVFPEVPKDLAPKEPLELPKEWKLEAVYMDQKRKTPLWLAVVSGDILRVGSKNGEFRVESITGDEVIFIHSTGRRSLAFSKNRNTSPVSR